MAMNRPFSVLLWRAVLGGGSWFALAYVLPETSLSKGSELLPEGYSVADVWAGVASVVGAIASVVLTVVASAQLTLETRRPNYGIALLLLVSSLAFVGVWGATSRLVRPLLMDTPWLWTTGWLGLSGIMALMAAVAVALERMRAPSSGEAEEEADLAVAGVLPERARSRAFCARCGNRLVDGECQSCESVSVDSPSSTWEGWE